MNRPLPPANTEDILARRFSAPAGSESTSPAGGEDYPEELSPTPRKRRTSTPRNTGVTGTPSNIGTTSAATMVRRTFYLSRAAADALTDAADSIHHESRGKIPKHAAFDALIRAGVEQAPQVRQQLLQSES